MSLCCIIFLAEVHHISSPCSSHLPAQPYFFTYLVRKTNFLALQTNLWGVPRETQWAPLHIPLLNAYCSPFTSTHKPTTSTYITNFEKVNTPPTKRPTLCFSTPDYNSLSKFLSPWSGGRQCLLEFGAESKQLEYMEIWEDQCLTSHWGWKFEFGHSFCYQPSLRLHLIACSPEFPSREEYLPRSLLCWEHISAAPNIC